MKSELPARNSNMHVEHHTVKSLKIEQCNCIWHCIMISNSTGKIESLNVVSSYVFVGILLKYPISCQINLPLSDIHLNENLI